MNGKRNHLEEVLHRLQKMVQTYEKLKGPPFQINYITGERVLILVKNLNPVVLIKLQGDKWTQFKADPLRNNIFTDSESTLLMTSNYYIILLTGKDGNECC